MSYPEETPHHSEAEVKSTSASHPHQRPTAPGAPVPPTSVTLSIFDTSLSSSTRAKAFVSALAINLLLPFINGVMLGFGEIFAKNVVLGWLGWKSNVPGSTAASLGLRKTRK
jgi:hypothetical protein